MEKLGVVTDEEMVKTSGLVKTCPKCGRELPEFGEDTNVLKCSVCGTEPFEKRPEK